MTAISIIEKTISASRFCELSVCNRKFCSQIRIFIVCKNEEPISSFIK